MSRSAYVFILVMAAGLATLATPALAHAQDIDVRGPANAELYVVTDRGRVLLGTLGADGVARVPQRLVERDKELEIVLDESASPVAIALVERGQRDPTCLDTAPAGRRCRDTNTFIRWGRVTRLTVTPAGQVSIDGGSAGDRQDVVALSFGWFGDATVGQAFLAHGSRLCDDALAELGAVGVAVSCANDTRPAAWSGDFGVTFAHFLAAQIGYMEMSPVHADLTAISPAIVGRATAQLGRTRGVTLLLSGRVDVGPFVPYVEAGTWRWSSPTELSVTVVNPSINISESQDHGSWDPVYGAGVEFWFLRQVAMTAGARFLQMKTGGGNEERIDRKFRTFSVGLKIGQR